MWPILHSRRIGSPQGRPIGIRILVVMTSGAAERVVMRRADGNPISVLVVDDESVLAEMVSMALRYEGWDISTAGDGSSAIAAARTARMCCVGCVSRTPDCLCSC